MPLHPLQRLYRAEDLVRRRRADEYRRYVASQRAARIDPNPHQIDAVIFALARLPDGGCILADEVGLGKTIEAGLVIAQLLAEGARRVLVVTPKALLGQWKQELYALFAIEAHEVARGGPGFDGEGVFLATRDLVGSEAGAAALTAGERFDLCVIDEAHEVFAAIYKRFDRDGVAREGAAHARIAGRLVQAIAGAPMLLLTATPLQNSLLELWGLVHYVDPTGTLLGDLSTFRTLFCPTDDRVLADGQEHELQRRLGTVLQRTLRRQAQDFMQEPFMGRQARLFEYTMSGEERALYDDVTTYLLQPSLYAFRGNHRKLLLLGFHRRMASSVAALAASLARVADRLRALLEQRPHDDVADDAEAMADLEDDDAADADEASDDGAAPADERAAIAAELARVEDFIARARALPSDSKARSLCGAVRLVAEQAVHGKTSGKVVIFTESLTTQDYVRDLLIDDGLGADDITLFRGDNDSPRAAAALARWQAEIGAALPAGNQPSPDVAVRLALVHEFRTRSRVFISTEAGAKGLNLQFCDTVINYDLPWNPQRIEQRIGRCHRYGQQRDVTVINFIAADNEAQQVTFDILSRKLDLFGAVLGATDEVLHRPGAIAPESLASALGGELEAQLRRIYERARSIDEVGRELRELRATMDARRRELEAAVKRTEDVIQRRFDTKVKAAFRQIQADLPGELDEFDRHVDEVVTTYLDAEGIGYRRAARAGATELHLDDAAAMPDAVRASGGCVIGRAPAGATLASLHLAHPLVVAAVDAARAAMPARGGAVRIDVGDGAGLAGLRGRRGRARLVRVAHHTFEVTEHLLPVVLLDGDDGPVDVDTAAALLAAPMVAAAAGASAIGDDALADAVDELLFHEAGRASQLEEPRYQRTLEQIERYIADRVLLLERQRDAINVRLGKAEAARDAAVGADQRDVAERALRRAQGELEALDEQLRGLRAGEDERYQRWRDRTVARRYAAPRIDHLFDVELEIT